MTETKTLNEIEKHLDELNSSKSKILTNIGYLLFSIILFVSFGLLSYNLVDILILIIVIFMHEAGHFIGMKIFGYRNVNVFFIPLLGAATTGIETNQSGSRKAIVSLLGPLPGILIGIVIWILYFKTKQESYIQVARTFLFINAFNLLPFLPLDGGRFLDNILFPRNVKIELIFKVLSCVGLLAIAYLLKAPLLGILAIAFLFSIRKVFKLGQIANELKLKIPKEDQVESLEVKKKYLSEVKNLLDEKFSSNTFPREIAKHIQNIWERMCNNPPKVGAVVGFIIFYLFTLFVAIASPFVFEVSLAASQIEKKIETYVSENGTQKKKETYYFMGKLTGFNEISVDNLYHGKSEKYDYSTGKLIQRGQWYRGKWDGEWSDYDKEGNLTRITIFDKGHFISMKELQNKNWIEKSIDDLPMLMKEVYSGHENRMPEGPKIK